MINEWTATVVTDCRSLYDVLTRAGSLGQATTEKRLAIEILIMRQKIEEGSVDVRWCPTTHMLADALTKNMRRDGLRSVLAKKEWTFGMVTTT